MLAVRPLCSLLRFELRRQTSDDFAFAAGEGTRIRANPDQEDCRLRGTKGHRPTFAFDIGGPPGVASHTKRYLRFEWKDFSDILWEER